MLFSVKLGEKRIKWGRNMDMKEFAAPMVLNLIQSVNALLHRIWTTFRLQTIMVIWKNYEVSELKALFHDTLDETSHCGRYPAIVQRRVHFLINLWFRPRKAVMSRLKRTEWEDVWFGKMMPSSPILAPTTRIWRLLTIFWRFISLWMPKEVLMLCIKTWGLSCSG